MLTKLLINPGKVHDERTPEAYHQQVAFLKKVWNDDSFGLERLLRLFLCSVQFLFPILLVRHLFGKWGLTVRRIAVEFYTVLKFIFPLAVLFSGLYRNPIAIALIIYLMAETLMHLLNLIYLSDIHPIAATHKRALLLLSLNYLEIVFDFSTIYIAFDLLSQALTPVSAIYFSLVVNSTVGFGDIHALGTTGQIVVIGQLLVCVLFLILFINYFSQKKE